MAQVSLNLGLNGTNDVKLNKAITDVNPEASDAQLYEFAQLANGLTTNTLAKITRIEKYEIENVAHYDVQFTLNLSDGNGTEDNGVITFPASELTTDTETAASFHIENLKINNVALPGDTILPHYFVPRYVANADTEDSVVPDLDVAVGDNGTYWFFFLVNAVNAESYPASCFAGSGFDIIFPAGSVTISDVTYHYNGFKFTVDFVGGE